MRRFAPLTTAILLTACAVPQQQQAVTPMNPAAALAMAMGKAGLSFHNGPLPGQPAISQTYTGTVPVFGRNLPLPPGGWTVAVVQSLISEKIGPLSTSMALVQYQGARLNGVVFIDTNARSMPQGFMLNPICTGSDVMSIDVRQAIPNGNQDCMAVNFDRPALWRQIPTLVPGLTANQMDLLGIQPPNILVGAHIYEANANWTASEAINMNPDIAGITPDMSTQRGQSAWTAFNYTHDPAKVKFVEGLKAQAEMLRGELRRQIETPAQFVPSSGLTPA